MKNKLVSLILTMIILSAIAPVMSASAVATADGIEYQVYVDEVEITGYKGGAAELVIPSEIEGLPVTVIGRLAFSTCRSLTSVIIPDSVIGISDSAFANCYSLANVSIPNSITSIDDCAFMNCKSLTRVNIPESVTYIGRRVFENCGSLTAIEVYGDNPNYKSVDGVLFSKSATELIQYPIGNERTNYAVPDGVTTIDENAFRNCLSLTDVTIPDSVTTIGDDAFWHCNTLANVSIGNGVISIGAGAFDSCESLTNISIGSSVKSIGEWAFYGCKSLTSVNLPGSVTSIGYSAFSECESLTDISMGSGVTTIEDDAFSGCTALTAVTIGSSVTAIGGWAFSHCTGLESVTIPESVTSIGYRAFPNCDNLRDVYYSGSEEQWNKISIGDENDSLLVAKIHFESTGPAYIMPEIDFGSEITVRVKAVNIPETAVIIAVGYGADNDFVSISIVSDGIAVLPADGVTTVKVLCWESLGSMIPLCKAEVN